MAQPSMRTLVLAELNQALKDGPLFANINEDAPSILTPKDLQAMDNEDLLVTLITLFRNG